MLESNLELRDNVIDEAFVVKDNTVKQGYKFVDSKSFHYTINRFIQDRDIRDTNGELWNFTAKQTRKTSTKLLIDNGINLDGLQNQLGHSSAKTTYREYVTVSRIALADTNTEFYQKEFDERITDKDKDQFDDDEIQALFEKFCVDYRRIYYNRKLLGVCNLKVGEKCPYTSNNNNDGNDFPCSECPSLLTGEGCRKGWIAILNQQEENLATLLEFYNTLDIPNEELMKSQEYRRSKTKYLKAKCVIDAIDGNSFEGD